MESDLRPNAHEELARERKATALAGVLVNVPAVWAQMVAELLDEYPEAEAAWFRTVEEHAGVNRASAATWRRVAEILAARALVVAALPADPFSALPGEGR